MSSRRDSVAIVLAKRPVAGRVKTRLTPSLTAEAAAQLAAAALTDTMRAVDAARVSGRVLAFDGAADGWRRPGWDVIAQPTGTLDLRLGAAFAAVGPRSAVLVGMDTPQLTAAALTDFDPRRHDACFGPARDGGFWAIGFRDSRLATQLIHGVPMSRCDTGAIQLARLQAAGLRVRILDTLIDVDTVTDAAEVAARAPHTVFARTWDALGAAALVAAR